MKYEKIFLFFGIANTVVMFLLLYKYSQDNDLVWLFVAMWSLVLTVENLGRYFLLNGSRLFKIVILIINVGILFLTFIMFLQKDSMWLIAGISYFVSFCINFKKKYIQG